MRTPGSMGDLFPIAVPGFIVLGAIVIMVTPTLLGALAFSGPIVPLLVGLATAVLVFGYLVAGLQETLSTRLAGWALPPASHLGAADRTVTLSERALGRAGYDSGEKDVDVPLGHAFALERALAGAWGTPEGAGWDRVAFLQRLVIAFAVATVAAGLALAVSIAQGGVDPGVRSHTGSVFILGLPTWVLLARFTRRARTEAVLELFADARALLLDRGEVVEVRRVLRELGLGLQEETNAVER